jgi:MFS family permease
MAADCRKDDVRPFSMNTLVSPHSKRIAHSHNASAMNERLPVEMLPVEISLTRVTVSQTQADTINSPNLERNLTSSLVDVAAFSVMVGMGETYFIPFVLALGMSATAAGMLATVPVLLGATLQLITPWAVNYLGSRKKWIVATACGQVVCLLLLPLAIALSHSLTLMAFLLLTLSTYYAMGLAGGPPWNTWIEEIVPLSMRTHFFAKRQRLGQICLFLGFVCGGLALQAGKSYQLPLCTFAAIFLIAAISRIISCRALACKEELPPHDLPEQQLSWKQLFTGSQKSAGGWLVIFLLAMQVGVQFAGPYFAPYMLQAEQLSYGTFMVLIAAGFLGKALALPYWGRYGQKYGPHKLLWLGAWIIIPLSSLWILGDYIPALHIPLPANYGLPKAIHISGNVIAIAIIQPLSGIAWSAYELGMALMFLHGIPRRQRTSLLTWYNFGNSVAMVLGGLLGAACLQFFGENRETYLTIFYGSSFVRLVAVLCLLGMLRTREHRNTPATLAS